MSLQHVILLAFLKNMVLCRFDSSQVFAEVVLFETLLNPFELPFAIGECQARFNCLGPFRLRFEIADHRGLFVDLFHLNIANIQEGMVQQVVDPFVHVVLWKGEKSLDKL